MAEKKDWNAIFAERKAEQDRDREERLARARAAAPAGKEPFEARRFEKLYRKLNADDVDRNTPWETLIAEAERDYYLAHPELMTLEALVEHLRYEQGWA